MATRETEQLREDRPLSAYEILASANPDERVKYLLRWIEEDPEHRLVLPQLDETRAVLEWVDLSSATLRGIVDHAEGNHPWWNDDRQVTDLRRADLNGARLRAANLKQVDLREANLQEAYLGEANLEGALLEQVDLRYADLVGANLQRAQLGKANLEQALLEEADLSGSTLRFTRLREAVLEGADLQGADLWSADLREAVLEGANLHRAVLREARIGGADLTRADLRDTELAEADLQEANLQASDLRWADLTGANLKGATLKNARLQELDLSTCDITHVYLDGARLQNTFLYQEQLGGAIGEELAGEYREAVRGYLALENNFQSNGDPDAASWAYLKKRRMQKMEARRQGDIALQAHHWRSALFYYTKFLNDRFVEWLCDYGESIPRVLRALFVVYLLFTFIYGVTGSVTRLEETSEGTVRVITRSVDDLATFSLLAMSTSGSPVVGLLPRNELVHLLTATEALLGIALTGLLGYVVGHRIRR